MKAKCNYQLFVKLSFMFQFLTLFVVMFFLTSYFTGNEEANKVFVYLLIMTGGMSFISLLVASFFRFLQVVDEGV